MSHGALLFWLRPKPRCVICVICGLHLFNNPFCIVQCADSPVQLHFIDSARDFAHLWAGFESKLQQMSTQEDWRRWMMIHRQFPRPLDKPFLCLRRVPLLAWHLWRVAAEGVGASDAIEQLQFTLPSQTPERTFADFIALLVKLARLQMVAHESNHLTAHVIAIKRMNFQPVKKRLRRLDSRFFMAPRTPTTFEKLSRRRLAKIMG